MTSSPHSVDDYLPSLSRPSAWETTNRNRQLVSPLLSDNGSVHGNDDAYDPRTNGNVGVGWRRDEMPNHSTITVAHNRRQFIEAQEQLRMYKEELAKKNRLIHELTSLETPRPPAFDTSRIDQMLDVSNAEALSTARGQVAALQIKVDGLHSQIRELNRQLEIRDEVIGELRAFKEASKDAESKQSAVILSLRQRVIDSEAQHGALEGVASRSEHALATLQRECHESQQQIVRLEADLRSCSDENSTLRQQRAEAELRWNELMRKLSSILELSDVQCEDVILSKVEKLLNTGTTNQSNVKLLERSMEVVQLELKANRETISRLSSEKDQFEARHTQHVNEISTLRRELDSTESGRRQLQIDLDQLRALLDQATRDREACQLRNEALEREVSSREEARRTDLSRHSLTISDMLTILSSCDDFGAVSEATIVDRVKHLTQSLRDKKARVKMLEKQLAELSEDLESHRARLAAVGSADQIADIEHRLVRAENELAAGDVLRDNLRADKEKFLEFLERLGKVLVVNAIAVDVGLDGMSDAILARAEQLIKNEATELSDRKSHIFNLQRKLKIMKDQLDSKDVHMELLRKKTVTLEERLTNKSDLEREKDEESVRCRKLMKLAEKYKRELNEAHMELRDMRARLLTTSELQVKDGRNQREIERLESEVRRLDELCREQAAKLSALDQSFSTTTKKNERKREETSNMISALTSELRTTKQALDDVTSREQQLVDLRCVIARMLGLAIDTLAVPDYEVVTRLEQLILANQANAATAFALDSAISDLGDGFRTGYRGRLGPVPVVGVYAPRGSSQHMTRVPAVSAASRVNRDSGLEAHVS